MVSAVEPFPSSAHKEQAILVMVTGQARYAGSIPVTCSDFYVATVMFFAPLLAFLGLYAIFVMKAALPALV